ncbi:hypothetical protein TG4357_02684 [Thalassovita gelatinovora]|uniref:Uncharacterized protein n=1 Tax=Thalassovita gelatinovora TaxID=53501 RepID=A0A0P1FG14_THAGE|nr:hypothetical protein [Thalassovita gelatinovora]QIZ79809.1 hypothetical protein HFZ77_04590 [Thalassovita gelatinovora]CUH66865.1 hypothetical protein TG4357_02684 [Thalassovita gelatinovora]SEQ44115.1 hypothetical protein SAMN04488043_105221 [Thalassovita gelatinovora]
MLKFFLMMIAMAAQGGGEDGTKSTGQAVIQTTQTTESIGVETAPQAQAQVQTQAQIQVQPQPVEAPSAKFTTAQEVRPILGMTKASWIAVREYDGHDIVYFTQLLSWRCGLNAIRYSINGGPLQLYDLPPCHDDTASPNALVAEEGMPIMGLPPKSVQQVYVEIFYDDMTTDSATFDRKSVLMP